MKFLCKRDLWWVQQPGYTGVLRQTPGNDNKESKTLAFKKGKSYEIIPCPIGGSMEGIMVMAKGEKGKLYVILRDDLHVNRTRFALDNFDFTKIGKIHGFEHWSV